MEVLKNKCALITGATGGLGENIAKFLANQGTNLVLLGRNLEKLKKLKSHLDKLQVDVKCFPVTIICFSVYNLLNRKNSCTIDQNIYI